MSAAGQVKKLRRAEGVNTDPPADITGNRLYTETDAVNWDGATSIVTYDVSSVFDGAVALASDAIWALKYMGSNGKEIKGGDVDHPSESQVRFTFGADLPAGTYKVVGVG